MADCKRKTANLFDADIWYGAYKISDGTYQTNRNTWYTLITKPFTNDDIGKSFCFAANIEPSSGNARFAAVINGVQINGQYTGNRCIVTFTVQTIDDKIIFDYGSGSTTITTVSNIMLNTGTTPLPYEPYGWQHSLRKLGTATDTITTLPAVLYPNGSTATVGLKGNTVQSTTPTPQNPVMPQGTGERTGNLFDKSNAVLINGYTAANGTITTTPNTRTTFIECEPNTTYTVSRLAGKRFIIAYTEQLPDIGVDFYGQVQGNEDSYLTITTNSTARYLIVYFYHASYDTDTVQNILDSIMINTGSTALPYEPYGYFIEIEVS